MKVVTKTLGATVVVLLSLGVSGCIRVNTDANSDADAPAETSRTATNRTGTSNSETSSTGSTASTATTIAISTTTTTTIAATTTTTTVVGSGPSTLPLTTATTSPIRVPISTLPTTTGPPPTPAPPPTAAPATPPPGPLPSCTDDPFVYLASTNVGYQQSAALIQQRLVQLGYNPGEIDGYLGPNTLTALQAWLDSQGIIQPAYNPDSRIVDGNIIGYLGLNCSPPTNCSLLVYSTDELSEYSDVTRRAQQRLAELGYNPGDVDGYAGPNTRAALERWGRQGDKRLFYWGEGSDGFSVTDKGFRDLGISC